MPRIQIVIAMILVATSAMAQTNALQKATMTLQFGRECEALYSDPSYFIAATGMAKKDMTTAGVSQGQQEELIGQFQGYSVSQQTNPWLKTFCAKLRE